METLESRLTWSEVERAARVLLNMDFGPKGPLEWGERAWGYLGQGELTSFASESERCLAKVRFLALCWTYHDFSELAFDIYEDRWAWGEWAELLDIHPRCVCQLANVVDMEAGDVDLDDIEDELIDLAQAERGRVLRSLAAACGSLETVFAEMWASPLSLSEWVESKQNTLYDESPEYYDRRGLEPSQIPVDRDELWSAIRSSSLDLVDLSRLEMHNSFMRRLDAYCWLDGGAEPKRRDWKY